MRKFPRNKTRNVSASMKTCKDTFIKGQLQLSRDKFDLFIQKKSVYKLTSGEGGRVKPIFLPAILYSLHVLPNETG